MNHKVYVGQKKGAFTPQYLGSGLLIQRAIRRYGSPKFRLEVVGNALDKRQLDELEKTTIAKYRELFGERNVYNISDGGQGGRVWKIPPGLGKTLSTSTRMKLSLAHQGWVPPIAWRKKVSERLKGKPSKMLGKTHSEYTKQLMREHHRDNSGKNNPLFGKHQTERQRAIAASFGRGTRWMYNTHLRINKHVSEESVNNFLCHGWILGMNRKHNREG